VVDDLGILVGEIDRHLDERLHLHQPLADGLDPLIQCPGQLGLGLVERAIKARRHKPMFMVDLAVPRDIESEVGRLNDVFLYTVDDLGKVVQTGLESRQAAVAQAETIIETRVQSFMSWVDDRAMVPVIQHLHENSEALRLMEVERARKMLAKAPTSTPCSKRCRKA